MNQNIGIINTFSHTKSTGKIAYGLYKHLKEVNNCTLFYGEPSEEKLTDPNVICITSKAERAVHIYASLLLGNQGEYSFFATRKLLRLIKERNIRILYLFNIHGYYLNYPMLFNFVAKEKIKIVYIMLDEYAFMGKCCFSFECEKFKTRCSECVNKHDYPKSFLLDRSSHIFSLKETLYNKVDDITFASIPYIIMRAKESYLLKGRKMVEVEEGIDLRNIYYPRATCDLRRKLGISEEKVVVLLVAPFSFERKGATYFLELAKLYENDSKYVFINVGFDGDRNICPSNFIPISYVKNQNELSEYYSLADCFVCTSLAETVADTCLEALACGTPVLGFACSGLPFSVKEEHCIFVSPKSMEELSDALRNYGKKDLPTVESCRRYAEQHFDLVDYMKKLEKIIE